MLVIVLYFVLVALLLFATSRSAFLWLKSKDKWEGGTALVCAALEVLAVAQITRSLA